MQAVDRHAASGPLPSQLARVENVAKLRSAIDLEAAVVVGGLQISKIQAVALVSVGRSIDDARRHRSLQPLAQPLCQDEIGHVVKSEGELQAVFGYVARSKERAGVGEDRK